VTSGSTFLPVRHGTSSCRLLALPENLQALTHSTRVVQRCPSAGSLGRHDHSAAAKGFAFKCVIHITYCLSQVYPLILNMRWPRNSVKDLVAWCHLGSRVTCKHQKSSSKFSRYRIFVVTLDMKHSIEVFIILHILGVYTGRKFGWI